MFKCYFIKRKLYPYLDNTLNPQDLNYVKEHLSHCHNCRVKLERMAGLIKAAQSVRPPELDSGSWHDFKVELDRKLNARLVPEFKLKRGLVYQLRPVLVYASVLIFIIGLWAYKIESQYKMLKTAYTYDSLEDEASMVDELAPEMNLNHDEDSYIDEINLLIQMGGDVT